MGVASAKSTPGRWILEGAPAPTPPHLQVLIQSLYTAADAPKWPFH